MSKSLSLTITEIYQTLLAQYGPPDWWPADSAFEVIVGAILTQNTSWTNVEKAIANLKNFLHPRGWQEFHLRNWQS